MFLYNGVCVYWIHFKTSMELHWKTFLVMLAHVLDKRLQNMSLCNGVCLFDIQFRRTGLEDSSLCDDAFGLDRKYP